MRITVDDSTWPLVRVRLPAAFDDHEWSAYLALLARFPDRCRPYVTLTDGRGAQAPNASQRRAAAELIERERARTERWNVANAVLLESAVLRGVLTALRWMAPPPVPLRSFAHEAEALAWLADRYAGREGAPPPWRPER